MRILILEADEDFTNFLRRRLEERCFAVDATDDANLGLALAEERHYDLVILADRLSGTTGLEICAAMRRTGRRVPVIMTSESDDVFRRIDGFHAGVDDYVVRPCYFDELFARMSALLRRPPRQDEAVLTFDDLTLDAEGQRVRRGDVSIYLTKKEFALLEYFLRNATRVLSRTQIFEHVWQRSVDPFSNTIETHIMNLRKKIACGRKRTLIHSVSGRGYKLDVKR